MDSQFELGLFILGHMQGKARFITLMHRIGPGLCRRHTVFNKISVLVKLLT
jgi:hypothetical protein